MFHKSHILAALFALLAANSVQAADISFGKSLQQKNCMSCHDDGMYTREDRKVTTLGGLQKQVKRCELTLGLKWFDEDVAAVTDYLNTTYYHYK